MSTAGENFYSHRNNSTVSSFAAAQGNASSQVSTVGFNNLKKTATNISQTSSISTSSTLKSNALSRLFTKNRSGTNVSTASYQSPGDVKNNAAEHHMSVNGSKQPESSKSTKSKFKLSKKGKTSVKSPSPSKQSNSPVKSTKKPQLTIQTGGHHGLKISKKILSSSSLNEESSSQATGRKNSINSPASTFHSFFHRSHNTASHNSPLEPAIEEQQKNLPGRNSLTLSSNNSNSYIADVNYALAYNFTDPDFMSYPDETAGENHASASLTFMEIHKKLLVPTDHYLQTKIQHKTSQTEPSIGLGITEESEFELNVENNDPMTSIFIDYLANYNLDFGKSNTKFFTMLLSMTKSLFTPTKQSHLSNGLQHPCLGYSLEDLASFIKNNYISQTTEAFDDYTDFNVTGSTLERSITPENQSASALHHSSSQKSSKSKLKQSKFQRPNSSGTQEPTTLSNTPAPNGILVSGIDEFKIREISQDLFTYFLKCMIALHNDLSILEDSKIPYASMVTHLQQNCKEAYNLGLSRVWAVLSNIWSYFNQKIRFFILCMFQPFQSHLHDISIEIRNASSASYQKAAVIDIENNLLRAFREVFIIPALLQRQSVYSKLSRENTKFSSSHHSQVFSGDEPQVFLLQQEENFMKKNKKLLLNLINCLGSTQTAGFSVDIEQNNKSDLFVSAFTWLCSLSKSEK